MSEVVDKKLADATFKELATAIREWTDDAGHHITDADLIEEFDLTLESDEEFEVNELDVTLLHPNSQMRLAKHG